MRYGSLEWMAQERRNAELEVVAYMHRQYKAGREYSILVTWIHDECIIEF